MTNIIRFGIKISPNDRIRWANNFTVLFIEGKYYFYWREVIFASDKLKMPRVDGLLLTHHSTTKIISAKAGWLGLM